MPTARLDSLRAVLPSKEEMEARCLQLGLAMRRPPSFEAVHPALTLAPSSLRRSVLEKLYARQLLWNEATDRMARNYTFLRDALRTTAESDAAFTGRLCQILERVYLQLPPSSSSSSPVFQDVMLGIFRTDYMRSLPLSVADVHDEAAAAATESAVEWKNVEINTISCSFAGLSPLISDFHSYLSRFARLVKHRSAPAAPDADDDVAVERSTSSVDVPAALAAAVEAWELSVPLPALGGALQPIVLVVIQEGERNTVDQYKLLFELLDVYQIPSLRRTLTQLHASTRLVEAEGTAPFLIVEEKYVASVVYFRSTYVPEDFPTEETWAARETLERSNAVKCPSIPYHLMTFKKIQQLMTNVKDILAPVGFGGDAGKAAAIAEHFMPQYSLNKEDYKHSAAGVQAQGHDQEESTVNCMRNEAGELVTDPEWWIQDAVEHPDKYVLKPQLEGGGNLYADAEMQSLLRDTPPTDPRYQRIRKEYILMRRIRYPVKKGLLFKYGVEGVVEAEVCSELGIFGVILSSRAPPPQDEDEGHQKSNGGVEEPYVSLNQAAGYVVRTKPANVADGGVMAGVACLDSVVLTEN